MYVGRGRLFVAPDVLECDVTGSLITGHCPDFRGHPSPGPAHAHQVLPSPGFSAQKNVAATGVTEAQVYETLLRSGV